MHRSYIHSDCRGLPEQCLGKAKTKGFFLLLFLPFLTYVFQSLPQSLLIILLLEITSLLLSEYGMDI